MIAADEPVKGAELDAVIVPDGVAAPDVGMLPPWFAKQNNLAGDEELTKWAQDWVSKQYDRFVAQDQRTKFQADNITADNMYRMGQTRDTTSKQHSNTKSNVVSSAIYKTVRAVVAMEKNVFLLNGLPFEYEPEINNVEIDPLQARAISDQQTMLEQHTWEEDNRKTKCGNMLRIKEKSGQCLISVEWDRIIKETTERDPTTFDDKGNPTKWQHLAIKRVVKDCPSLVIHPIENCYFDASKDNSESGGMDDHQCVIIEQSKTILALYGRQEAGEYMNCNKLDPALFYVDPSTKANEDKIDKAENAGESISIEANGSITVWQVEAMLTIKEKERKGEKNGKGKLDLSERPRRYLLTFAGPSLKDKCVCLRFVRQPYYDDDSMFRLVHALPDDKGAYHQWYAQMLQSQYWQIVTMINQCYDNVDLRNKMPWVADGRIESPIGKFRANQIIKVARGVKLEQLAQQDTTMITMPMIEMTENDINQTTGAEKPGLGEPIGQRAAATEAKQLFDQSLAILDDKFDYIGENFAWIGDKDARLWRRFGDPTRVVLVTHQNEIKPTPINPAELYGPIKIKVTAASRFKNSVMARQEMNGLIQNLWDKLAPIAGSQGMKVLAREVLQLFNFKHIDEILPPSGEYEAQKAAQEEYRLLMETGKLPEINQMQNHVVRLAVFEPLLLEYRAIPDRDEDKLAKLEFMIQSHKNMAQAQNQTAMLGQATGGGSVPPAQPTPPATPGQAMGDMVAGEMGGQA